MKAHVEVDAEEDIPRELHDKEAEDEVPPHGAVGLLVVEVVQEGFQDQALKFLS